MGQLSTPPENVDNNVALHGYLSPQNGLKTAPPLDQIT